jgi:hypothetical protein
MLRYETFTLFKPYFDPILALFWPYYVVVLHLFALFLTWTARFALCYDITVPSLDLACVCPGRCARRRVVGGT